MAQVRPDPGDNSSEESEGAKHRAELRELAKKHREEEEALEADNDNEDDDVMAKDLRKTTAADEPVVHVYNNITERPIFGGVVMSCILLNALQMGMELQFREGYEMLWLILENFFTAVFAIELCIKLVILGPRVWAEEKPNILDGFIVVVAVLDNWIVSVAVDPETLSSLGFISILRLVRLSRILKLLKAKRELMMLIEGILASIKSMIWLGLLLGILVYVTAIVFVQFLGDNDSYPPDEFDNKHYFGDLVSAGMTALNLALLSDWTYVARPVLKYQPFFFPFIGTYVAISSFGIMNAIIGVIVTRTSAAANEAEAEDKMDKQNDQMCFVAQVSDIIYAIDADGSGSVSREEMKQADGNEDLQEALDCVDLPFGFKMSDLHLMLDKDGDGELSKSEFYIGMKRLIFSDDFQSQCLLMLAIAQQKKRMFDFRLMVEEQFEQVHEKLDGHFAKIEKKLKHVDNLVTEDHEHGGHHGGGGGPVGEINPPDEPGAPYTIAIKGATLAIQTHIPPSFQPGAMSLKEISAMECMQVPDMIQMQGMQYAYDPQYAPQYPQGMGHPNAPYGMPPGMEYNMQDNGAYGGMGYQNQGDFSGPPNQARMGQFNNGMRPPSSGHNKSPNSPGSGGHNQSVPRPPTGGLTSMPRSIDPQQGLLVSESIV